MILMTRKKGVTTKQINFIKEKALKGWSANRIQKAMQREHIGMKRQETLRHVREFKGKPTPKHPERHVPHKYRRAVIPRIAFGKEVTVSGTHHGKRTSKTKHGSGTELCRFVRREMSSGWWDARPKVES
jgi:hypothetical protein